MEDVVPTPGVQSAVVSAKVKNSFEATTYYTNVIVRFTSPHAIFFTALLNLLYLTRRMTLVVVFRDERRVLRGRLVLRYDFRNGIF